MPASAAAALCEVQLQQRLVDGDHAALADCYDQYAALVYTVALRTSGSRSAAEDITQDVFLKLWTHPLSVDLSQGTTRAWLGRVSHNRAVDWIRSEAVRHRRESPGFADTAPPDVQEAVDAVIQAEEIRVALDALPADQRVAIQLAYFGNQTYEGVANQLGIPEGTAKSRIRLGLQRMAATLCSGASEPES